MQTRSKTGSLPPPVYLIHDAALTPPEAEPVTYKEAVKYPCWQKAMQEEYTALQQQHTWTLEELPSGRKPIGCKWVYKIKRQANGKIAKYKVR